MSVGWGCDDCGAAGIALTADDALDALSGHIRRVHGRSADPERDAQIKARLAALDAESKR